MDIIEKLKLISTENRAAGAAKSRVKRVQKLAATKGRFLQKLEEILALDPSTYQTPGLADLVARELSHEKIEVDAKTAANWISQYRQTRPQNSKP